MHTLLILALAVAPTPAAPLKSPVVDPGQDACYDNRGEIAPPKPGELFHGQDAQVQGARASYEISADGLTALDRVTGLTWQRSPDTNGDHRPGHDDKLTWTQAQARPAVLNAARFGGFDDWRLPTIKELYSLFDARGTDPSGLEGGDTSGLRPYLDTNVFAFAYGDESRGERIIDAQFTTATQYTGLSARGSDKVFGVNFADGRIKGYDLRMPGGGDKKFFVLCVRGNPDYGRNDFHDSGDGTITDRASGLIWSKADSGKGLNWEQALAWVREMNGKKHLGHDDWRLPDIKELQSLVDYTRGPDTTKSAAIDPFFTCSTITNEGGQADFPFYWSSTSHIGPRGGAAAMYVAFGRAPGWLSPRGPQGGGEKRFADVHGAGAQRSDPKSGDPAEFPHGRGPQGDVIRIFNYVRLVRGGGSIPAIPAAAASRPAQRPLPPMERGDGPGEPGGGRPPAPPLFMALDANADGALDAREMDAAAAALRKLDRDGDGRVTLEEMRPRGAGRPEGGPPRP